MADGVLDGRLASLIGWVRVGETAGGIKVRLISVGDCVADRYIDDGVYYPGGQAVNVAANASLDGAEAAAFLGIFADDDMAGHIRSALAEEGVRTDRCRVAHGTTPSPGVRLVDGERTFFRGRRDSVAHLFRMRLASEDLELISTYDVCHTTNDAGLDEFLPQIHAVVPLSYDFSTGHDDEYLARICPSVDIAFFSGEGMGRRQAVELMRRAHGLGTSLVIVTMGEHGSLCFDGEKLHEQGVDAVDAVDTMGAGDSYAAGFLVRYFDTRDVDAAMAFAARRAARTCTVHGAFGHPGKIE